MTTYTEGNTSILNVNNHLDEIIRDFVKNAPQMTPEAQNIIAKYISVQSMPKITLTTSNKTDVVT